MRNTLQKSVGSIKKYELKNDEGEVKSIAEIRRDARIKRFQSPHKSNSHVPLCVTQDDTSIVTPSLSIGTNNNSCSYGNELSHKPIDLCKDMKAGANVVAIDHTTDSDRMHKAVMKCLLSDISPTSSAKKSFG